MLAAANHVHATTAQFGTWVSYTGTVRVVLAVGLLAAAAAVAFAAVRLPLPLRFAQPSARVRNVMIVSWLLSIAVLLAGLVVLIEHVLHEHVLHTPAVNPITPVTVSGVCLTFLIVLIGGSSYGMRVALTSAAVAAMAAPMIFEFPFDLIVMARTSPPIPPAPALVNVAFFAPLLVVELTTVALLSLSPMVRLSRAAFLWFAVMLGVFAVWALFGFAYPLAPVSIALNMTSKILAFVATLSLFLPQLAAFRKSGEPASPSGSLMQSAPPLMQSAPPSGVSG